MYYILCIRYHPKDAIDVRGSHKEINKFLHSIVAHCVHWTKDIRKETSCTIPYVVSKTPIHGSHFYRVAIQWGEFDVTVGLT